MGAFRFLGLLAVVPVSLLLSVSFFVLFTAKKSEQNSLKSFGWVVAVLLWLSAALIFSGGMVSLATGRGCGMRHPMMMSGGMMKEMPRSMMQEGRQEKMREGMKEMMKK